MQSNNQKYLHRIIYTDNMPTLDKHQVKQTISFGGHETRVLEMQDYLMKFHGNNKSQLIKNLIRKEYASVKML